MISRDELADKAAIAELVQTERAARDQGQWDRFAACYHKDSVVSISWIECSGPEFVEASKAAFARGIRHLHQMAPTIVNLNGDRALAETGCAILLGGTIGGVVVTVTSQARLFARIERRGVWRIARFSALYFQDALASDTPGQFPSLDTSRLATYRPSYRHLAYLLAESGKTARPDLPGIDRPELCDAFYRDEAAWLADGATAR